MAKITIRLEPPFMAEHPLVQMGTTQLDSTVHGPFRFSPTGVACGPVDNPAFVAWSQTAGVVGWEPPTRDEQRDIKPDNEKQGKFRP